ncbi:J domain-containing protein [Kribbella sp. NPDC051586]|uniref:J domain-containing protein n=1 Tax=Kribbella sp. NPDC051586 TaxID=3364118 RepID=UPI00378E0668
MSDHYEVLSVERSATTAEIKSAYRRLVRQVHPDQGGNAALFRLVQEAWTTLGDPAKRAAYDRTLGGPNGQTPPRQDPPRQDPPRADPPRADSPPADSPQAAPDSSVGPIRVVPRFGRWRVVAGVLITAWLVMVVGPLIVAAIVSPKYLLVGVAQVILGVAGLPAHWRRRIPFGRAMSRLGILFAITFLITVVVGSLDTGPRTVLWVEVGGLILVRLVGWRWTKARDLDRAIDEYAAYDANVWGRPGEPLVDDGRRPPLPPSEVLRTRRTARILEGVVAALPAAKLVHGPVIGGLTTDHLVIADSRVAVVTSVVAPPGTYSIDLYGSVLRDGQPYGGDPGLGAAVNAWQGFLRRTEVRGFLVVLPMVDGQHGITTASSPDAAITCLSPQSAFTDLNAWLQPGSTLDRRLLYDVLYQAPVT